MRVLWLSNKILSEKDDGATGTWLDAMAQALVCSGEVQLGNIAQGKVARLTRQDCGAIHQWIVPAHNPGRDGLPPKSVVAEIVKAVGEFSPDLVHIWGTEGYWGLLTARGIIRLPSLLETQGLKGAIARVFAGGLTIHEQLACIGLKEIVRGATFFQLQKQFEKWGEVEREVIQKHQIISTQSEWMHAQVASINPSGRSFHTDPFLRQAFYAATPWQSSDSWRIFCLIAYASPFKGLHIALRALKILKRCFPDVQMRIGGGIQRSGIRQDGYVRWLNHLVKRLDIEDNVHWLGALSASEIVSELQACAVMVIPTFIENCCTSMQEAMMLGVPLAASYVGGLPSLARDEDSALFFPAGDAEMCAYQLERLLTDGALAERIGRRAREVALPRNDPGQIVRNQLEIYRQVVESCGRSNSGMGLGEWR